MAIAEDNWGALDGFAVSQGMEDLRRLPWARFLNFIHWWATRNIDDEAELAKFETRLWRPPAGVAVTKGPWSPEAETAAFGALKASVGQ